ncbi:solute carrier organic anion transporter family member 4A1 [Paramuricea clavata]|uniref:Solute carrier organic anion transporter family member 4A1 n=1 Tax=Paramuricea clavata TaxID=317549 RepID=A0A6S7FZ51_PARCT|nr:solute carrier organic anion transporter family member 4A1 [Paramuricea clavata]
MGMQYVFLKTIGLIPGPIILGHLLDLSCQLWQDICGQKGRCFVYDVDLVSRNICIFGAVITGFSVVLFALSWFLHQPEETSDVTLLEGRNVDGISSFETVL